MASIMRQAFFKRSEFRVRVLGAFVILMAGVVFGGLLVQRAIVFNQLDSRLEADMAHERRELSALITGNNPQTGQPFGGDARAIFDTFLARNLPQDNEVYVAYLNGAPY